jgi:hypothetical protein
MNRKTAVLFLVLLFLFCAACKGTGAPGSPSPSETIVPIPDEPTPTAEATSVPATPVPTPEPDPPYRAAASGSEPEGSAYEIAVSLFDAGTTDFDGERKWTVSFEGLLPRTVDRCANPMRFSDDLSVWMTYDRDGEWDNCLLGRCISDETDWFWLDAVLFSREYVPDPDAVFYIQTPRFTVRKGDLCLSSTSLFDEIGQTYYIDDDVCTYWIDPNGSVIRADADGTVYRSVDPLNEEQIAYLYLLYEAHYMTPALQYPLAAYPNEMERYRLYVECNGVRVELPVESFASFLKLVTVDTDRSAQTYAPCFACTTELFADSDYPENEILRFRFVAEGYDPDASPHLWFSLREDGRIVRDIPIGAGYIHTVARWRCFGRNRIISKVVFPVDEILAYVKAYGLG